MGSVLITGGTGFVGSNLIEKLLEDENNKISVIVEEGQGKVFNKMVENYKPTYKNVEDRLQMFIGDLTNQDMGWCRGYTIKQLAEEVEEFYHLAAVYRLDVGKKIAHKVNVEGTKNVLDMAKKFPKLKSLNYVSTCYVSGKRKGIILEDELDKGQKFNNHYEETKFKAEMLVRKQIGELPIKIIRPTIIVGNSKSGKTISFNGLYYAFDAVARGALFAKPGRGNSTVNFIPIDFVVDTMTEISKNEANIGRTFQIADPNPMKVKEIIETISKELNAKGPIITLPHKLVDLSFKYACMGKILKIQKELIAYFNSKTTYDTTNTLKSLENTRIECPKLSDYIGVLIDFWNKSGRPTK